MNNGIEAYITTGNLMKFAKLYHRDEVFRKSFDEKMKELDDKYRPYEMGSEAMSINITDMRHTTYPPREFRFQDVEFPEGWDFERIEFKYQVEFADLHSEYGSFEIAPCKTVLKQNTIRMWRKQAHSMREAEA
jgi:hypothetical protein